jgi:predicted RNase H-like HicB family nuclease
MKRIHFNVFYKSEPEGGFTAMVPTLPGCITYGKNLDEARKNADDAINGYIASLAKHKEPMPSDDLSFVSSIDVEVALAKR